MIVTAIQVASINNIITIPTAIQNIANPQIFFIVHFDSKRFIFPAVLYSIPKEYRTDQLSLILVYVVISALVHKKNCQQHMKLHCRSSFFPQKPTLFQPFLILSRKYKHIIFL